MTRAPRGSRAAASDASTDTPLEARIDAVLDALDAGRGARDTVLVPIPSHSTDAVTEVRSTVRDILEAALPADTQFEVQLVCSELVTNALEHGEPPVRLLLHETPGHLIVAVHDRSPESPRGAGESPTSGLRIVDGVTENHWGVAVRDGGKWVWAAIRRRPAGP